MDKNKARTPGGGEEAIVGEALVAAAKQGDRAAFSRIAAARIHAVRATLRSLLGPSSEVDERTVRVLVEAWRTLPDLAEERHFDAWLLEQCISAAGIAEGPLWGSEDANRARRQRGDAEGATSALRSLVPTHRNIVLLRRVFDLTPSAVGRALEMPTSAVIQSERIALGLLADELAA